MRPQRPAALRVWLAGLVDYAGLFPPASLDLPSVVARYAGYRRGPWAWMLGRLVVPAARLEECAAVAGPHLVGHTDGPWRLAALLGADPSADLAAVGRFNTRHAAAAGPTAVVDVVEGKLGQVAQVGRLANEVTDGVRFVVEVPWPDAAGTWLDVIAGAGATAKLRTGGLVPEAIPSAPAVAAFLWETARRGLAMKVTAGLHHPLRGEYPLTYEPGAPVATLHGFLNVFAAAAAARRWAAQDHDASVDPVTVDARVTSALAGLLERRDAGDLRVDAEGISWAGVSVSTAWLARAREHFALSFGSCSFEEPIEGLQALGLLTANPEPSNP